jgi:hypothetical protein
VGGPLLAGLWCHILSIFLNNGFNGAPWDVQSLIFILTQPGSVLLHNFIPDLFGELLGLHRAACLVVQQNRKNSKGVNKLSEEKLRHW